MKITVDHEIGAEPGARHCGVCPWRGYDPVFKMQICELFCSDLKEDESNCLRLRRCIEAEKRAKEDHETAD